MLMQASFSLALFLYFPSPGTTSGRYSGGTPRSRSTRSGCAPYSRSAHSGRTACSWDAHPGATSGFGRGNPRSAS